MRRFLIAGISAVLGLSCQAGTADPCRAGNEAAAPSTCLTPKQTPAYYVEQAHMYFDRLDMTTDPDLAPNYSERSVRWEWAPWLKLTGYTREGMLGADLAARLYTSTVPERDCRAFDVQPFARCYVRFLYAEGYCGIYEEFTFNDQGEMTFIEAWSDMPEYLPMADPADTWAEGPHVNRLSTRVPGLGGETGLIDPTSAEMTRAGERDADVADLALRTQDFYSAWLDERVLQGPDYFARGCGW
jgi:hypothetical protein